jgi:hypothetical protein
MYPEYYRVFESRKDIPDAGDDIHYYRQKREFLFRNVRKYFLGNNWIFDNGQAAPQLVKDMILSVIHRDHVPYLFNMSFITFYEFLVSYFPNGKGIVEK